jgi:hypothetical protein
MKKRMSWITKKRYRSMKILPKLEDFIENGVNN